MLMNGQIDKLIGTFIGSNREFERAYLRGEIGIEVMPQGTLAEKIKSGGKGIPAFWTRAGVGTVVEYGGFPIKYKLGGNGEVEVATQPKISREFNGKKYIMEETIFGDVALVKAYRADKRGNLQYRLSARAFNEDMATAAKYVIAEVEEIVENGEIDPNDVHTPGVFVDSIVLTDDRPKAIEVLIEVPKTPSSSSLISANISALEEGRERIARRIAREILPGLGVNIGIGIPTRIPKYIHRDIGVNIYSENGVIGIEGYPGIGESDPDMINAGCETVCVSPGASFFSSSDAFGMVRGGHLDITVLGALQVSSKGDLANWIVPGKMMNGMGGAMDLANSGAKVIVAMEHTAKGAHKIVEECSLPLTGKGCVTLIVTEKAVFDYSINGRLTLREIAQGSTLEDIRASTGCPFELSPTIGTF